MQETISILMPCHVSKYCIHNAPQSKAATQSTKSVQDEVRSYLLKLSDPGQPARLRQAAADKLWPLTRGEGADQRMQAMVDIGGVPLMIGVLRDKSTAFELRGKICNHFQNLATNGAHRDVLVAVGAVPLILQLFSCSAIQTTTQCVWYPKKECVGQQ